MKRQPLVAALASALVPGAGQLYAGDPYRAAIVFSPAVLLLAGAWNLISRGSFGLAELLVQPSFLRGILTANAVILAWRIAAAVDAWLITRRAKPASSGSVVALIGLLAVLAMPQLIGWTYGAQTISTLESVFVASSETIDAPSISQPTVEFLESPAVPHPILANPPEADPASSRNLIFRDGVGDPDAIAALVDIRAPATPVAPFLPLEQRVNPDRLTILLVGGDAGPDREGLRTDSINVATIDLETGSVAMFGFPRNLKLVPLPPHLRSSFLAYEERVIERDLTDEDLDGFPDAWVDLDGDEIPDEPDYESCRCFPEMLNKVYGQTADWDGTYPGEPDPGLAALRDIVSHLMDIPIDYYLMVEMAGFVRSIDAIGGVDVYVSSPYHVKVSSPEEGEPKAQINVEQGMNHLSGSESLAYARWRIGSSDYNRMGRQRCVMKAAATQADTVTLLRAFPTLLDLMEDYVTTDIPITFLPDLVRIAGTIDRDNVATIGFTPPTYNAGRTPGHYPIPNVERIRWKVQEVLEQGAPAQSNTGASECDPPE
ncbi:MAG: LCP family protein [Acidimicrobiia bacterium]